MEGCGEPLNLDEFAAVSHGISRACRIWQNFLRKIAGPNNL